MSVCEHSWTPYVSLPPGHEWGREDVLERCEKCGVAHTGRAGSGVRVFNQEVRDERLRT
jgi:hypothetical protein